jgi:hypothetical protein
MKRFALLLGVAVVMALGCAKGGPTLDGKWSMLVSGTDGGSQSMVFSEGKNWTLTTVYEADGAKYTTTANGTYKLEENGKKLTMTTTGSDLTMEGGTEEEKKAFAARREGFLKEMEAGKGMEDVSQIRWFNDNSFESVREGNTITFHRK